jgi:hypothetical protein
MSRGLGSGFDGLFVRKTRLSEMNMNIKEAGNKNIRGISSEFVWKRKSGNQMLKVKVDLSSSAFDFDFKIRHISSPTDMGFLWNPQKIYRY